MSKRSKKLININKNEFPDRNIKETEHFPVLHLQLETIDGVLLLLDSQEDNVLINVLKHIVEQARRTETTISLLKEKNLLQLLLHRQFFRNHLNIFVKRLSLFLASSIIENSNCLVEVESSKLQEIVGISLVFYRQEDDDFCCEYLSVIINKCSDDPQCSVLVLQDQTFMQKYFSSIAVTSNPDILFNSLELLLKLLLVQGTDEKGKFVTVSSFPLNRLLCELNCEFFDIRKAVLKVLHFLLMDFEAENIFNRDNITVSLMQQLTTMFCESALTEELILLIEVLAATMEHEFMISCFFESNLFYKYLERLNNNSLTSEMNCKALSVCTECAQNAKLVARLVSANMTEKLLECLLTGNDNPAFHILLGLNRLMKSPLAAKIIIDFYDQGLLEKLLKILSAKTTGMKAREQSANLLENLLSGAFKKTTQMILDLKFIHLLANMFAPHSDQPSSDLLVSLLKIIETMAENADFRKEICKNFVLITNIGLLLKNSFSNGILVMHLFRCLCGLVAEEEVHHHLLKVSLCSSIKRALQSSAHQVRTAVTNFIMQTTRFPKFMETYNHMSVLEVLLMGGQRLAFCVATWQPAIESILAKNLTMKFCIRNSLGFVDITADQDFMISKRKFNDFRLFECILKEEVSPLRPVIVVNFNRPKPPADLIVKVPAGCSHSQHSNGKEWCYCRSPGDEYLPKYLQQLSRTLEAGRAKVVAQFVAQALGKDLHLLDLNASEECSELVVNSHLKEICIELHCSFIPLGRIRSGCKFERAILFKALADQVGLPCTLQRSVDGRVLFNEIPLPVEIVGDNSCTKQTLAFVPWRMLRPTHIVDLMYNVGDVYPLQSRQALQYLRLF